MHRLVAQYTRDPFYTDRDFSRIIGHRHHHAPCGEAGQDLDHIFQSTLDSVLKFMIILELLTLLQG